MSSILNTYSSSFRYDLNEIFSLHDEDIKNFLTVKVPDILNKNDGIKEKIINYKNLKKFLGEKRNREINEDEFIQNRKYFKDSASIENVKSLKIDSYEYCSDI